MATTFFAFCPAKISIDFWLLLLRLLLFKFSAAASAAAVVVVVVLAVAGVVKSGYFGLKWFGIKK